MSKEDEFIEEWEKVRNKSKLKYILTDNKYFIITYFSVVIITFVAAIVVSIYTGTNILNTQIIKKTLIRIFLVIMLFIVYAYMKWIKNEKKYNRIKKDKSI